MIENVMQIYPDALDRVPKEYKELVEREVETAKLFAEMFDLQEQRGLYPGGLQIDDLRAAARLDRELLSPYKFVKWRRTGFFPIRDSLKAVDYLEDSAYRDLMLRASGNMEGMIEFAYSHHLPDDRLIEASLNPQIQALRHGTFEEAIFAHLNTRYLPPRELYTGLVDRYGDKLMGIKRSWSAWVTDRDDVQTAHYNAMVESVLSDKSQLSRRRVIVGNAIAKAGLPAKCDFSGDTLPCEDYLRRDVASESYIWLNVLCQKVEDIIKPNLRDHLPDLTEAEKWELKAKKGATIYLVLHEGYGHHQVPFDESTEEHLRDDYPSLKELACDALTHEAIFQLPKRFADTEMKKYAFAACLAWAIPDIEAYLAGVQQGEKSARNSYGQAGLILTHCYEQAGCIEVNPDNGNIQIKDLDKVKDAAARLVEDLNTSILLEKFEEGLVKRFIKRNSPTF